MRQCSHCGQAVPDGETSAPSAGSDCLTRQEIAQLACKILALGVFAHVALGIMPVLFCGIRAVFDRDWGGSLGMSILVAGLVPFGELIFGAILWKESRSFARRMVSDDPTPLARTDLRGEHLLTLGFALIGMYAVWASSEHLIRMIAQVFFSVQEMGLDYSDLWYDAKWQASSLGTLASLGFGLWLLLGSHGVVRLVQRVQGREPSPAEPAE